jgi:hypothetical protein
LNLADEAAGVVLHWLSARPTGEHAVMARSSGIAAGNVLLRVGDVPLAGCKMAQAVAKLCAVPALTQKPEWRCASAVRLRRRRRARRRSRRCTCTAWCFGKSTTKRSGWGRELVAPTNERVVKDVVQRMRHRPRKRQKIATHFVAGMAHNTANKTTKTPSFPNG